MDETSQTQSIIDHLDSLRSILRSEDDLQIQPSGDYEQVRIKLDHDVQVAFFFDQLNGDNKPLTINNVFDLRITKSSNKCSLTNEQWTNLRKHFDELTQPSNGFSLLITVIESIQDYLCHITESSQKARRKEKKSNESSTTEDASTSPNKFLGADIIFNRILHDKTIDRSQVIIGYKDRFTGIHEIAFNDFKKVHEHEYGVPMHRIQHYKINGQIVWDRSQKLDSLTRSDRHTKQPDGIEDMSICNAGVYRFDHSLQQWIQCPNVPSLSDDSSSLSTDETCLPQRCHFLTWNILFNYYEPTRIHSAQRYKSILETLNSILPDVVCLQEVTMSFLTLLLNQAWLQENNYYMILMKDIIRSDKEKSYGQIILTKNFRPRSFSICPLPTSNNASAKSTIRKTTKEIIIARFNLNAKITIDLVNLHLHSDLSTDAEIKRCQALENLFKQMRTNNYMLIGDFNFGDLHIKEQNTLAMYEEEVRDLWKDVYNVDQNPGFTFDPSKNICAQITSQSQISRRLDRYLIHTVDDLSYSIEDFSIIGKNMIPVDALNLDDNQHINLSDHYALQLIMNFRARSVSHRSALVVLPTTNHWETIDSFRQQFDPSFQRWPPHINLLWPFFDLIDCQEDLENILLPLRLILCEQEAFSLEINEIDSFIENNICFMKPNECSTKCLKRLFEQLVKLFPQCLKSKRGPYNPHMTIGQFDSKVKHAAAKSALILTETLQFPVPYIYILQRSHDDDTKPFHISYQLPLGSILPPLNLQQSHSVHRRLQAFFQTFNLYETDESYQRKRDKFDNLASCLQQIFNKDTLHHFKCSFLPYGSFRIGINGHDVDTVFLLEEIRSSIDETSFDTKLRQMKHDSKALNKYIANLIEMQINGQFKDEIKQCRKIEALFPIISIIFNDETNVEISIQAKLNKEQSCESDIQMVSNMNDVTVGVHEVEYLLVHARCPPIFQHLLAFIRAWAQNTGIYGQVYGYLGGYSWAILCAHICHKVVSSIESLSSVEQFSIEQFFYLVQQFFSTFAQFNWSSQVFRLHPATHKPKSLPEKSSKLNRGSMRIISPSPPFNNTGRVTTDSTRDLIVHGFQRVLKLFESINTLSIEDKCNALQQVLELSSDFPNEKTKSLIELTISSENSSDLNEWVGWIKSRLAHFMNDCEEGCHLKIQPQGSIEYRCDKIEALYSIGFQLDSNALSQHQNFTYWLQQFMSQSSFYSNRKESMKITYRIVSVADWKLERMQPKPPRMRD